MTRVKICGLTNREDALLAAEAGADALGFILISSARRFIGADLSWLKDLPPFVSRVAVVEDLADLYPDIAAYFDSVQYYADTTANSDEKPAAHLQLLPVLRLRGEQSLETLSGISPAASALVIDAFHPGALGGTGTMCDWNLATQAKARSSKPLVLAGGLTPNNVGEAVQSVRPFGVDVSSGVEAEIRRKDPEKVRAFISATRAAESRQ